MQIMDEETLRLRRLQYLKVQEVLRKLKENQKQQALEKRSQDTKQQETSHIA